MLKYFLILIQVLIIFTFKAFGQREVYCQGCCACLDRGQLVLDDGNRFNISYNNSKKSRGLGNDFYGEGKYLVSGKLVILYFEDPPPTQIAVEKIKQSDSLMIYFNVKSTVEPNLELSANVSLGGKPNYSFSLGERKVLKKQFEGDETVSLAFIGLSTLTYQFKEPGIYNLKAIMGIGAAHLFRKGETMKFKKRKTVDGIIMKCIEGGKVKFTTEPCGC